eukprot:scaffold4151_cov162-Amphora_coffeaeformis.AAC.2
MAINIQIHIQSDTQRDREENPSVAGEEVQGPPCWILGIKLVHPSSCGVVMVGFRRSVLFDKPWKGLSERVR